MIRFSLVISRRLSPESAPNVQIKLVNLAKDENFSEEYLTQVNSRGQVSSRNNISEDNRKADLFYNTTGSCFDIT